MTDLFSRNHPKLRFWLRRDAQYLLLILTSWKCFLIDLEIGIIILNLLWKTYLMCILLSDCTSTLVIRQKNKRAQTVRSTNNLVLRVKKLEPRCEKRNTSSRSWPCKLGEGRCLWEINCSLRIDRDVSNKLLNLVDITTWFWSK